MCNTQNIPFYQFRYDITVRATGRFFTDFLQSVDNIHSQFCFTYPKMKSPSIYLTEIDNSGCVLVYRSGRQGFTQYVMGNNIVLWQKFSVFTTVLFYIVVCTYCEIVGQLQQIATDFYKLKLNVKVIEKSNSASGSRNTVIVTYRLDFDNSEYVSLFQKPKYWNTNNKTNSSYRICV